MRSLNYSHPKRLSHRLQISAGIRPDGFVYALAQEPVLAVLGFTLVIRKPQKIIVHILFHNITRENKLIFVGDKLGGLGQDSMWILPRKTYPGTVILSLSSGCMGPSSYFCR